MAHRSVAITPGSGDNVAFDGEHQIVKIGVGAEGTANDWEGAVTVSSSALPTGAATEATLATASSLLDSATNMLISIEGFQTGISNDLATLNTTVGDIVTGAGFASETTLASALKAEDAVAASGDKGIMALAVRADTAAATGANGDYVPLLVDSTGRLHCNVSSTVSTSSVCNVTQVASTAVLTGNGASGTGALRITLASDSTGNIATIGTSVTPGTAAANLGKAEDAAHTSGDVGVMALALRRNTASSTSGADNDYQPLITNTTGHLWVDASGQTLAVGNVATIGTSVTPGTSAGHLGKAEDAVAASGDTGVAVWGVRRDTPASNCAAGDYCEMPISGQGASWTTVTPSIGGGWTPNSQTALSNTKTQISAAACTVGGYIVHNPNAAVTYIQVWNLASASVTVGTTAPTWTIGVPANGTANLELVNGILHGTGFTVAATTTATGSTAPSAACVCTFLYK